MRDEQNSNRQAQRAGLLALADFANMGDSPKDWRKFQLKHPHFFPESPSGIDKLGFRSLTEWIYTAADEWAIFMDDMKPELKTRLLTPLLWYRNRLRLVWANDDPDAINLMVLLGFEKKAMEKAKIVPSGHRIEGWMSPFVIPGQPFDP
jgi:hypothetical protein